VVIHSFRSKRVEGVKSEKRFFTSLNGRPRLGQRRDQDRPGLGQGPGPGMIQELSLERGPGLLLTLFAFILLSPSKLNPGQRRVTKASIQ